MLRKQPGIRRSPVYLFGAISGTFITKTHFLKRGMVRSLDLHRMFAAGGHRTRFPMRRVDCFT